MRLSGVARRWLVEPYKRFDATLGVFSSTFNARKVTPKDGDTLDGYRLLVTSSDTEIPTSKVVKNDSTGVVSILGRVEYQCVAENGTPYTVMTVSKEANCIATVTRKVFSGTGWLQNSTVCTTYGLIEHLSDSEDEFKKVTQGYRVTLPESVELQEWDFLTINGTSYRVISSYVSDGFRIASLSKEEDLRIDFTFKQAAKVFNSVKKEFETVNATAYATGLLSSSSELSYWVPSNKNSIEITVDCNYLSIEPKADLTSVTYNGVSKVVKSVSKSYGGKLYVLRCE